MPKLVGSGILHSKLIVSDARSFYVGSANMDWRALSQVPYRINILRRDFFFEIFSIR